MKTHDYQNDGSRITAPGKFQGEPVWAPEFWQLALEGFADSEENDAYVFKFAKGDKEWDEWPTLREWMGLKRVLLMREDSQGFVHCFTR